MRTLLAITVLAISGCGSTANAPRPTAAPEETVFERTERPKPALCESATPRKLGRAESPALTELSGLARTKNGTFWTHNDSGDSARVFQLSKTGAFVREVALINAQAIDWEDIAIRGNTLYVADIGDNLAQRDSVAVYRFAIPTGNTAAATTLTLRYPDGAHDAEALLVDPRSGQLAIVTKDFGGASAVYVGKRGTLKQVATLNLGLGQAITAGDVSADGRTVALRSYDRAFVWEKSRKEPFAAAFKRDPCNVDADLLDEGQGESLALSRDGRAFYTIPEGANPVLRRYGG